MKINLVVSIDTECDKGPGWRVRQPLGFSNVVEGVPERLQPLFEDCGVKPTYLLSPEVMRDEACVAMFRSLGDRAELGTHLHSEFIEPEANLDCELTESFLDDYPADVEREKLHNLTELFKSRFGYNPRSFRAGRFALSCHTLGFLEDLGYRVDSSVTPYTWWWRSKGVGVNFLGASDQPYFPDRQDFRRPGDMEILEVPITLTNRFWRRLPLRLLRAINPIRRAQTIALKLLIGKRLQSAWLRPTFSSAAEMLAVTEQVCAHAHDGDLVLCMMFHSNEATAGMSPYNSTAEEVGKMLDRLRVYFTELQSRMSIEPVGLSNVAAHR